MPMRPSALSALLLVAVVGCGVPETAVVTATPNPKADVKPEPKKDEAKPDASVKPAEQDPAKLGEKIVDTKVGTGAVAEIGDTCVMKYAGRLKDGTEFDSNMKPDGKPFSFRLGEGAVIKGWDLGVKGMRVGGKRTLEIPSALGYGEKGGGDKIPPNSDLIFDIELVDVQKAADAATVVREIITPGTGPAVKTGDVVSIKYKGMLADGSVFDDRSAKPVQFKVGAPEVTIPGLNLALIGMKKGQKVTAKIPPSLGYQGPPSGKLAPGTALTFEIELVKIG